jgi:hypothetical protein
MAPGERARLLIAGHCGARVAEKRDASCVNVQDAVGFSLVPAK